jgi:hypothetical protein
MSNTSFLETEFTSQVDFIIVQDSATNSGLPMQEIILLQG